MGFEDVRDVLARFDELPGAADPGGRAVWSAFARQRRTRAQLMLALMAGLKHVYAQDEPLLQLIRNLGVRLTREIEPLKRQLVREALGLGPLAARW